MYLLDIQNECLNYNHCCWDLTYHLLVLTMCGCPWRMELMTPSDLRSPMALLHCSLRCYNRVSCLESFWKFRL